MNELLVHVEQRLNNLSNTHPNLTNLWREYIHIKIQNLETSLVQCKQAIDLMNNNSDITNENILALYLVTLVNNEDE